VRDQAITTPAGPLAVGCDAHAEQAWLEVPATRVGLRVGELLMTIEALAMAYAELSGARPDSAARGVSRTLRNRARAARERSDQR
jgi:hypothetical protein